MMKENIYTGIFADIPLLFSFNYKETASYFQGFLKPYGVFHDHLKEDVERIRVEEEDFREIKKEWGMPADSNTEFLLSMYRTSDRLLPYKRVIVHGAAFLFQGKAYLFVADSGTGKTTQIRNWLSLYSDEIRIMNGDKPILKLEEDDRIFVCPSPWKGKEKLGDDRITAPLGGVILLKQGKTDLLREADVRFHAPRLLSCFFSRFETEETIAHLCRFQSVIWNTIPVWTLMNTGTEDSARILHDVLSSISGDKQGLLK